MLFDNSIPSLISPVYTFYQPTILKTAMCKKQYTLLNIILLCMCLGNFRCGISPVKQSSNAPQPTFPPRFDEPRSLYDWWQVFDMRESLPLYDQNSKSFVVNGYDAREGAWPWIASLQSARGYHFCGGTLITTKWVSYEHLTRY